MIPQSIPLLIRRSQAMQYLNVTRRQFDDLVKSSRIKPIYLSDPDLPETKRAYYSSHALETLRASMGIEANAKDQHTVPN